MECLYSFVLLYTDILSGVYQIDVSHIYVLLAIRSMRRYPHSLFHFYR